MWDERLAPVILALQRQGRHTVLFHQALAERVGLNATDSRVLSYLDEVGAATAGELAGLTGLTTGAVTRVIDRLEEQGFVRREADARDRRKVVVVMDKEGDANLGMARLFASFGAGVVALLERYSSEELEIVRRFAEDATRLMREETAKLVEGE